MFLCMDACCIMSCLERYNEKQARIAERRRINYEKKLVVSYVRIVDCEPRRMFFFAGRVQMSLGGELQREVSLCSRPTGAHQVAQGADEEAADLHQRHLQDFHLWQAVHQQEGVQRAHGGAPCCFQGKNCVWVNSTLKLLLLLTVVFQDSVCSSV